MNLPAPDTLFAVIQDTWPAAEKSQIGPWIIRDGQGGGNRVSAASTTQTVNAADLPSAEAALAALGQPLLFMVQGGQSALDNTLAQAGYRIKDHSVLYAAPVADIATRRPPPVTSFEVWPPLQVQLDIWTAGGIGPARIAIMDRAAHPKTTLLGRLHDKPAGTAFISMAHDCAMIHALEVAAAARRQGHAGDLTRAAAFWAARQGATYLTLITTTANTAANALYTSLGFQLVGHYHYRIKQD